MAFGLRSGAAAILHFGSLHAGGDGFVTSDDRNYASLAWALVIWSRDTPQVPLAPPAWGGHSYLLGTFVYIQTALFWLFGNRMLLITAVNAACARVFIVVLYDMGAIAPNSRRNHPRRVAPPIPLQRHRDPGGV